MHMIVLASTSPRRRELLTQVGLTFTVASPDILEEPLPHEAAADYVSRMAEEKARAVFDRIAQTRPSDPSDPLIVIGADTCVLSEGEILGKPSNRAEAQTMLEHLSGRTHQVLTGIATVTSAGAAVAVEVSQVVFDLIKPEELRHYLDSGEPLDKAGAYGIQGYAARWIPRVEGCYFNVVGLPIARTMAMLDLAHQQLATPAANPSVTTVLA
jgi:septum formation protein